MKSIFSLIAATAIAITHAHAEDVGTSRGTTKIAPDSNMTHGEIEKIDATNGMLIIKHGPLRNLGMSDMTMGFNVVDPAMLKKFRTGDKVDFVAEMVNGIVTVTRIEQAK